MRSLPKGRTAPMPFTSASIAFLPSSSRHLSDRRINKSRFAGVTKISLPPSTSSKGWPEDPSVMNVRSAIDALIAASHEDEGKAARRRRDRSISTATQSESARSYREPRERKGEYKSKGICRVKNGSKGEGIQYYRHPTSLLAMNQRKHGEYDQL